MTTPTDPVRTAAIALLNEYKRLASLRGDAPDEPLFLALEQSLTLPVEQPAGWVLVPIEPTDEMIASAIVSWHDRPYKRRKTTGDYARDDWAAMLKAAPEPCNDR